MPKESFTTISMRRIRMKFHAKRALPGNWLRAMFLTLLLTLTTLFSIGLLIPPVDLTALENPPASYQELLQILFPNPITRNYLLLVGVILLLYWLVVSPLRVAMSRFFIGVARLQKPKLLPVLAVFCDLGLVVRCMGLAFWVGFLRVLWLLLFVAIPVLVLVAAEIMQSALLADMGLLLYFVALLLYSMKSLAYAPATVLFAENPSIGVFGAVKKSLEITRGHLTEYFMFDLSFLLWRVFASFAGLIGTLFFVPYYQTAGVVFIDSLRVRNDPSLAPQEEVDMTEEPHE